MFYITQCLCVWYMHTKLQYSKNLMTLICSFHKIYKFQYAFTKLFNDNDFTKKIQLRKLILWVSNTILLTYDYHWLTSGGKTLVSAAHTKKYVICDRSKCQWHNALQYSKNFNLFHLSFNMDPGWGDVSSNFNFLFCEPTLCFKDYFKDNTTLHYFFRNQLLSEQIFYQPSLHHLVVKLLTDHNF